MAIQSGNDEDTVEKDMSYSPASGRETEQAQDEPRTSAHFDDPDIDEAAVKSVPGVGGPDDAGDIDVDEEAIRASIARRAAEKE
ncbi:hypothetical protein N1027_02060 [Herbiconiux sp. CPCC 205763]|uniref:Uncharacterized protein n=1 Tax=Herbiconiux aconitum TaxID=2970913 RepID=A0ABT2GMU6_9MICO|nr:hypothetical protein [Herbiconiux aconitum]MCS5716912.1 hypothetical protein [Herbiconiux aconitum]